MSLNLSGSSILLTSLIISACRLQSQACISLRCSGSILSLDGVNITSFHLQVLFTENVKLPVSTHTDTYTDRAFNPAENLRVVPLS